MDKLPALHPLAHLHWNAFQALSRRRMINEHGPQPIQVSEIVAYADLMHITDLDDREDLLHLVGEMDQLYLSDVYKKRASEQKKASQKARRGARRGGQRRTRQTL